MRAQAARLSLFVSGWVALTLGIIGVVVPLLPTTVFVLIAAFCFARSSERFHQWLLGHRVFGPVIERYRQGRGLPRRARRRAVALMWSTMGLSAWLIKEWWAAAMLAAVGAALTVYLYRLPADD